MSENFSHRPGPTTELPAELAWDIRTLVKRLIAALSHDDGRRAADPRNKRSIDNISHAEFVRLILSQRRRRDELFGADHFGDPAWNILLDLYGAHLKRRKVPVSALCMASEVPPTTALRWISALVDAGLIIRRPDRADRRRIHVELAPSAIPRMSTYCDHAIEHFRKL